jgi:hypothetical protein
MEARPQNGPARVHDHASSVPSGELVRVRASATSHIYHAVLMPRAFDRFRRGDQAPRRSAATARIGRGLSVLQFHAHANSGTTTISEVVGGGGQVASAIAVGAADVVEYAP